MIGIKTIDKKLKKKKINFISKKNQKNNLLYSRLIKSKSLKKIYQDKERSGGLMLKGYFKKNEKNNPLISIVMPNYKSKYFFKSLHSVINQVYKNLEIIIIDGNSGKTTIDILKKYNNKIDLWISENDKGMWHAWNKGLKLARGEYVGIVDSSNFLFKNATKILAKYIIKYPKLDFICGSVKKMENYMLDINQKKLIDILM